MVDSTFKQHGLSYQVAMEVGGWEVIKKYVELGLGISIIINIGITGEEKLEVIPAGDFFPGRTYGVVLRKGRILTPQAKRFVSMVLNPGEGSPRPSVADGAVKAATAGVKRPGRPTTLKRKAVTQTGPASVPQVS
jgi:hypothetical protein